MNFFNKFLPTNYVATFNLFVPSLSILLKNLYKLTNKTLIVQNYIKTFKQVYKVFRCYVSTKFVCKGSAIIFYSFLSIQKTCFIDVTQLIKKV